MKQNNNNEIQNIKGEGKMNIYKVEIDRDSVLFTSRKKAQKEVMDSCEYDRIDESWVDDIYYYKEDNLVAEISKVRVY